MLMDALSGGQRAKPQEVLHFNNYLVLASNVSNVVEHKLEKLLLRNISVDFMIFQ